MHLLNLITIVILIENCFYGRGLGMTGTLRLIYREEGMIRGLYRGMSINYIRAIPMVSVSFTTYEMMKQALNLDTGIKLE